MYVCLCNAITDRDFRAQAQCEGCTVSAVYRALGATPQCGKCVPFVRQLLRRAVDIPRPEPAAAAG
jgi:bacterioferritin-associated ferredoxin